jgi:hypothetical protein
MELIMRKFVLPLAALVASAAALGAASPAFAGEGRVELRSGLGWTDGQTAHADVGAAAGYDWSLSPTGTGPFVGVEQSVDKNLDSGENWRWTTSGRIGVRMGANKLYATGGYGYGKGPDAPMVGAGVEHGFGNRIYGKVEYRKYFNEDGVRNSNAALIGAGVRF